MLTRAVLLARSKVRTKLHDVGAFVGSTLKPATQTPQMPFGASRLYQSTFVPLVTRSARTLANTYTRESVKRGIHTSATMRNAANVGSTSPFSFNPKRLLNSIYVLDTRLTLKLGWFLIPSLLMTGLWTLFRLTDNENALNFMKRHFTLSLQNLDEGRYWTIFSSAFGSNGNITGGGLAESCTFLLFGGNLLRSFGFRTMAALYFLGHGIFSSTFLYYNYSQHKDILKYEANVKTPGTHPGLTYTPRRDRRAMVLAISRATNEANPGAVKESEEKQRNLIRMPEEEFLETAKNYYYTRPAEAMGGGLTWALLGLRLHPLSVIPVPFVPIPIVAFVPVQMWATLSTIDSYPREELVLSLAPLLLTVFTAAFVLPRSQLHRQLPIELVNQMKLPSFIPRHIPDTRVEDARRAAAEATELAKKIKLPQANITPQQMEAMRKRNAKFQNKKQ